MGGFNLSRARGCFIGLVVGDALGAPLEFSHRGACYKELTEMVAGGPFDLQAGQWTDDTSQALCLADSLLEKGFDEHDQMRRYLRWLWHGYNSSTGQCFDIGNGTRRALDHYGKTGRFFSDENPNAAGNGSLMRLAPVVIRYQNHPNLLAFCRRSSRVTHPNREAAENCALFGGLLQRLLQNCSKRSAWKSLPSTWQGRLLSLEYNTLNPSGYCVHTLECALWCFFATDTFEEALIKAVNLCGDADTIGAVCGQLAGAHYGYEAIPKRWLDKLYELPRLISLADRLLH